MANYRQLHTKTWVDSWFMELSPEQKLLFIHLFSNQRASACGLYEMPIRVMSFETGLAPETIKKCLEVYNDADKVYYDFQTSVIWIVNMPKYQSSASPKLRARIEADIKAVPDCELKSRFLDKYPELTLPIPYRYGIDTLQSVSVSNSDSVSVEEGGVGGETMPRAGTGTTTPRAGTGTTSEEHLKATGHHAKRHHSHVPCPVPYEIRDDMPEPGLPRGNRDYFAGIVPTLLRETGTTSPRAETGTTSPRAETGTTSQAKSLKTPAGTEFIAHFGSFNGQREQQRWETLVEAIGWARAQEIASWAERKEIHMINRGGLMDSLETAAKKWQERKPGGKATAEERQMRNMENIRKGLEMAEVADGKF